MRTHLLFLLGLTFCSWTGSKVFSFLIEHQSFRFFEFQNQNTDGVWVGFLIWFGICGFNAFLKKHREKHLFCAVLCLSIIYAFSRFDCFRIGCCSGTPTLLPWSVRYDWGSAATYWWVPVHPVQIYCSIHGLMMASLLYFGHTRQNNPKLIYFSLIYYSLGRGFTDLFRADLKSHWTVETGLTLHGGILVGLLGVGVLGLCFYSGVFHLVRKWVSSLDCFWKPYQA